MLGPGAPGWIAGVAYIVALWLVLSIALHRAEIRSFRPADHVTLARAVLTGGVVALVADRATSGAAFVALVSVALALDSVDGLVARRTGTASPFGARFDMEVDAFLILVLSVQVAMSLGMALGWWTLTIGLMRYAFVAAARPMPWLRAPLPPSMARKTVAAAQGILLGVAGFGPVPHLVAITLAALALASLCWSFGRDIRWLWLRRPSSAIVPLGQSRGGHDDFGGTVRSAA
ncbi:CDP-alcohol phosphatidyltransferase family protein [Amycolatopsis pigmentata]|uniref:CDP-alcohol phosphatidyltransferase family protein n=1 Tax=Amycolatopsis pigmentata TaxID=450801 RepID=A0ABW5G3M1_9PSEU